MKLVVLGNGFDLHHGLNTSFDNFRSWCIEDKNKKEFIEKIDTIIGNNGNDETLISWAEYESKFHQFYLFLEKIRNIKTKDATFETVENFQLYTYTTINFWKGKERDAITNILEYFHSDRFGLLSEQEREGLKAMLNKLEIILEDSLESLSEDFSMFFQEYMEENVMPKINEINKKQQIQDIFKDANHVLTFNYTNVHKLYGVNDALTIHGEIEGERPLIMGFYHKTNIDNKDEEDDHLERYNGRLFSKDTVYYKLNGEDISETIDNFMDRFTDRLGEITIIGFSLEDIDKYVIKRILECKNIEGYKKKIHKKNLCTLPTPLKVKIFNYGDSFTKGQEKIKDILGERYVESKVIGTGKLDIPVKPNVEFIKVDYKNEEKKKNLNNEINKVTLDPLKVTSKKKKSDPVGSALATVGAIALGAAVVGSVFDSKESSNS